MKRKNLGNNIVKKAIVGAMIFMMAFTSVAPSFSSVKAAEVTPIEVVEETPEETVAPISTDEIEDAEKVVGNAIVEEQQAKDTAIFTIGEGIISAETQAILAEGNTNKDLQNAADAIAKGEEAVEKALEGVEEDKTAAETAQENAENEAEDAKKAKDAAVAANQNAQNATTSAAANAQATVAGQAAEDADEAAKQAAEEAKAAQEAADELQAKYDAAVKEAEAAVEAANAALAQGAEDAEAAVEAAKLALDRANAYKDEADAAKKAAGEKVEAKQEAFDAASERLNTATKNYVAAVKAEDAALKKEMSTGAKLFAADVVLYEAKQLEKKTDATLSEKKQAVEDLKLAKKDMEDALEKAKQDAEDAKKDKNAADKTVEDAEKAVADAQKRLNEVNKALGTAQKKADDAAKDLQEANDYLASLDDEDYEKDVKAAEEILAASANDEIKKASAEQTLVAIVINHNLGGEGKTVAINEAGLFEVTDEDGNVKYYSYEIDKDGQIDVYENTKNTTYKKVVSEVTGTAPTDENAVIEKVQDAVEATYTVSYTDKVPTEVNKNSDDYGTRQNIQREVINKDIAAGASFTITINGAQYANITKVYASYSAPAYKSRTYFSYVGTDGKTHYQDFGDGNANVSITSTAKKTVYIDETFEKDDVKASELSQYSSKKGYNAVEKTPAVEAKYQVTYVESENTVTQTELDATIDRLGEEVIAYEKLTDAVEAGTVITPGEEAEYTVTYKEIETETVPTTTNYGNRNDLQFENINNDIADGCTLTVKVNNETYTLLGAYKKKTGPDSKKHKDHAYLEVKDSKGHTKYIDLGSKNTTVSISGTKVQETETPVEKTGVKESELSQYAGKTGYQSTLTKEAVEEVVSEGVEATYKLTIYQNEVDSISYSHTDEDVDATQKNITKLIEAAQTDVDAKTTADADAKAALTTAGENFDAADAAKKGADSALAAAKEEQKKAEDELKAAEKTRDELQKKYDDYYKGFSFTIFGKTVELPSQYKVELAEANAEVKRAEKAHNKAVKAVEKAEQAQKTAQDAHDKATQELIKATADLFAAAIEGGKAYDNFIKAGYDLSAAKSAYSFASGKAAYAAQVQKEADEAHKAAVAAQDAVDALVQAGAKSGDKQLEEAKKALDAAIEAAAKAEEAAKQAAQDAEDAAAAYRAALEKVAALIAAEQAASESDEIWVVTLDADEEEEIAEVPAAPATPAAPARTRRAAVAQAPVEEVVAVPEEAAPLAANDVKEEAEAATLDDEETPLVAGTSTHTNWWWLLLLLLIPGGYAVYKNTAKAKEDEE